MGFRSHPIPSAQTSSLTSLSIISSSVSQRIRNFVWIQGEVSHWPHPCYGPKLAYVLCVRAEGQIRDPEAEPDLNFQTEVELVELNNVITWVKISVNHIVLYYIMLCKVLGNSYCATVIQPAHKHHIWIRELENFLNHLLSKRSTDFPFVWALINDESVWAFHCIWHSLSLHLR